MLSPSDYNSAVPQFTNGEYASNPINPLYVEEPDATNYNRGVEPLQTLPAQWWNWLGKQFTLRFNKLNIYVKNIFNELAQLLSLVNITPDGTEQSPTVGQLKTMFQTEYPKYMALLMYPIGSLYWTGKAPNDGGDPNVLFGGTWVQIKGMFVFAKGDSDTLNATGGTKTETLTINQIPSHTHTFTGSAVTSGANNRGHTHSVTASGTISGGAYKFSGTSATLKATASGTISGGAYKFTGSEVTSGGMSRNGSGSAYPVFCPNESQTFKATGNMGFSNLNWGAWRKSGTGDTLGWAGTISNNIEHTHTVTANGTISVTTNPTFTGSEHSHTYTPSGTISITTNPTFSGTAVTSGAESQNHTHSVTAEGTNSSVGGGEEHNNMPPYIVKYCWERTA